MLGLVISSQLALMHGAELHNIGFSLFIYIPLLFGMICGRHLELRRAVTASHRLLPDRLVRWHRPRPDDQRAVEGLATWSARWN